MPPSRETLPEEDVRAIVRLLGQVAGSSDDILSRKRQLMSGLARLVHADGWVWSVTRIKDGIPVCCGLLHDGLNQPQLAAWVESSQVTDPALPEHPACLEIARREVHATRTRSQLVPDAVWYAHPTVRRYRLDVGIDDFLYSLYPLGEPGCISAIGLYRFVGMPPFSPRDSLLTHIVLSEIPWLHSVGLFEDAGKSVPALSPRRRSVLIMLLNGMSRKEIAHSLRISQYTAKDHIEATYAHFQVDSQIDLVRRFYSGNGGHQP